MENKNTVAYKPPTTMQLQAWDTMDKMTREQKHPPSVRELMVALDWKSTSTTFHRLERGVKEGRVVRIDHGSPPHYVPAWWYRMIEENVEKYYENR